MITIKDYFDEDLIFKTSDDFRGYVVDRLQEYFVEDIENYTNYQLTTRDLDDLINEITNLRDCMAGKYTPREMYGLLCQNEGNFEECAFVEE